MGRCGAEGVKDKGKQEKEDTKSFEYVERSKKIGFFAVNTFKNMVSIQTISTVYIKVLR